MTLRQHLLEGEYTGWLSSCTVPRYLLFWWPKPKKSFLAKLRTQLSSVSLVNDLLLLLGTFYKLVDGYTWKILIVEKKSFYMFVLSLSYSHNNIQTLNYPLLDYEHQAWQVLLGITHCIICIDLILCKLLLRLHTVKLELSFPRNNVGKFFLPQFFKEFSTSVVFKFEILF